MSNMIIGSLRVALGLDSAQFQTGVAQAQNSLKRMGAAMSKAGAVISGIGAGVTLALRKQIDAADDMSKAAAKFGVPIESLSKMAYVADLSGVSMETMGTALGLLSKKMAAAGSGNKAAAAQFAALGVSVKDAEGNLRPVEAVMMDLSDVIAKMPDGAEKSALAMQFFGRSGTQMIPMLNGGAEAIRSMMAEAERFGLVITEQTGKSAEAFNDNISRLSAAGRGFSIILMSAMAPHLETVSNLVVGVAMAFQDMAPWVQGAISAFGGLIVIGGPVLVALGAVVSALGTLGPAFVALGVAVKAVGVAMMTNPILMIGAVLAGAALAIYQNWDRIAPWFAEQWAAIQAAVGPVVDDLKARWDNLGAVASALGDKIVDLGQRGFNWLAGVADRVSTALSALGGYISGGFSAGWSTATDAVAAFGRDALEWLMALPQRILEAFSALPRQMLEMGGQIVAGLKDGIAAAWDGMVAGFRDRVEGMKSSFKSWLGIASPSRVFRQFGEWITEGLGEGIQSGAGPVMQGITDLAQGLSGVFKGMLFEGASFGKSMRSMLGQTLGGWANSLWDSGWKGVMKGIGIPGFANGVTNFAGGLATINERGGELVSLPGGSTVVPHDLSRRLVDGGSGGTVRVVIEEAPGFAARVRTEAEGVAVQVVRGAAPEIVGQSVQASQRSMSKSKAAWSL
ncbi:phage tail tape measure protein [Paracoccus sp. p3-h83]|uniref:phage tail tape measure protein n=1 Tax=Paracoccus sp. p3-h83 TaxID=3342805 RepID=UPI0035B6DE47